jgi:hypothetical protein
VSVSGPVTATEPETLTVPETGCVACQKVPVTGVVGMAAMLTACVPVPALAVTVPEIARGEARKSVAVRPGIKVITSPTN